MPRALARYQCERTLACCRQPYTATIRAEEQAPMRAALATTEAGRAILPTLDESMEPQGEMHTWVQPRGDCMHLAPDGPERGCRIHAAAGLQALPSDCRNFPRHVVDTGGRLDVGFSLGCPTAARLLTEDPAPFSLVSLPADDWAYGPRQWSDEDPARLALRDAWMALVTAVREDAPRLVGVLGAMIDLPLAPPPADAVPVAGASVERPIRQVPAYFVARSLSALKDRGPDYGREHRTLGFGLTRPWPTARVIAAATATPELVAAFVEHQLHFITLQAHHPDDAIAPLAARRALVVLRIVETLCDVVPFRTPRLFADAYHAVAQLSFTD